MMCPMMGPGLSATNMLLRSVLVAVSISVVSTFPLVASGKRYGPRAWPPLPFMYQTRSARPYAPYYDNYIPEDLVDFYYPQDPYRLYQMPYYYPEQYYYDDDKEEEDIPDEWYNNGNAEANAIFLQNLILAQLYKDARGRFTPTYDRTEDYDDGGYVYGEPVKETLVPTEDKDVRQLESLKQRKKEFGKSRKSEMENRWVDKRGTTNSPPVTTPAPRFKGQDEVVMPRPANPPRLPAFHQRSYQPSVYDAIKKLLIQQENAGHQPQKRSYVLNEDSLVQQLGTLKKTA